MDDAFICKKLKRWAELLYGNEKLCYAKVLDDGRYCFGNKRNKNILTKPFALYIAVGQVKSPDTPPQVKKSKKKIKRRRKYD